MESTSETEVADQELGAKQLAGLRFEGGQAALPFAVKFMDARIYIKAAITILGH